MTEAPIYIREATIKDLEFMLLLEQEAFPDFQQSSRKMLIRSIRSNSQEVLIAEANDGKKTPAGSVILYKYKHTLRIYSIALLRAFQNRGIGDLLLTYVKAYAVRNNFERIILEAHAQNVNLIKWYEMRGFVVIKTIQDYYRAGEHACKMQCTIDMRQNDKKTNNIIVINHPFKWNNKGMNAQVISVRDYINQPKYQNNSDIWVFNLCTSYRYQSYGYYVSLLAAARGQRVIPSIATIRDFFSVDYVVFLLNDKSKNRPLFIAGFYSHDTQQLFFKTC